MAVRNDKGKLISYECSDLIADLKENIKELGSDKKLSAMTRYKDGILVYTNYMVHVYNTPKYKRDNLVDMTAGELLKLLELQNSII